MYRSRLINKELLERVYELADLVQPSALLCGDVAEREDVVEDGAEDVVEDGSEGFEAFLGCEDWLQKRGGEREKWRGCRPKKGQKRRKGETFS
jgi:hypothetical protein